MKKIREGINDFFLTNQLLRKVRNFFHQVIAPFFLKAVLLFITLLVLVFILLKIFKPAYLDKIHTKSSFYFFHYLNLDNHEFSHINISGNNRVAKEEILNIVTSSKKKIFENTNSSYQPLIQNLIDEIKSKLPWINQVVIMRTMPNILNISVTEYEPFAIWQNDGIKYIIDKEGNTVPFEESKEFENMVVLSGKGANTRAKSLFNIFAIDPNLSQHVYSATWIGARRWDIRLNNGLLIKLPEANISEAWQHLIKIYNMPGSIVGLKVIDLRIKDKVYLEYNDSVIKELKNI